MAEPYLIFMVKNYFIGELRLMKLCIYYIYSILRSLNLLIFSSVLEVKVGNQMIKCGKHALEIHTHLSA